MIFQKKQTIKGLLLRGVTSCVVCTRVVEDFEDVIIVKIDNTRGRALDNLTFRHSLCQLSKYRPVERPDLEELVEAMSVPSFRLCPVCEKSWVGAELEDLTLATGQGRKGKLVVHKTCVPPLQRQS